MKKTNKKKKLKPLSRRKVYFVINGKEKEMEILATKEVEVVKDKSKNRFDPIGKFSPVFEGKDASIRGTQVEIDPVEINVIPPKSKWQKFLDFLKNLWHS